MPNYQIEYVSSGSADVTTCGKPAVAECADCGASICSDCQMECCGDSFCGVCYDYHLTHSCVEKPVSKRAQLCFSTPCQTTLDCAGLRDIF
jgi:hypothetical protein